MSASRYSAGHTVLHAGVFALPCLPYVLLDQAPPLFVSNVVTLGAVWILGLLIHFVLLAVHEFGHAVAGRLVGIEIKEITIGHWRRVVQFKLGETSVTLRAAPDSGYVVPKPSLALASRWRTAIFVMAGLLAEIGVLLATWSIPYETSVWSNLSEMLIAYARMSVFCFVTIHVIGNAWPGEGWVGGDRLSNDGKLLFRLFQRGKPDLFANQTVQREARRIDELIAAHNYAAALAAMQDLSAQLPENWELKKNIGALQLQSGDVDAAMATWTGMLKGSGLTAQRTAELLDSLASAVLYGRRADLYAQADAWITEALSHAPRAITLKGTRGGLLIELGRIDEGVALLTEVVRVSEDDSDQAISLGYLAKVAALRGQVTEAGALLRRVRTFSQPVPFVGTLLAEVTALLEPAAEPPSRRASSIET